MSTRNLTQQTANDIYNMIMDGEIKLGEKLPGEISLSSRLGVSRTTLREALRLLTAQGVLSSFRGKGTFVTEDASLLDQYGLSSLRNNKARLKDLYEARLIFEPLITAIACQRATEEEMNRIFTLGSLVESKIKAGEDRSRADADFHEAIVAAAHNDFMQQLAPLINHAIVETIRLNDKSDIIGENTLADHAMLLDFLMQRDAQGAKQAMSVHLRHTVNTLHLNSCDEPIIESLL